ncbi:hypothetical protein L810_8489 [Burkholderia sp. AU4i]|nr:hypothetical protein L810_8489 [Burkholderia sp. AU4i]
MAASTAYAAAASQCAIAPASTRGMSCVIGRESCQFTQRPARR